MQHPGQEDHQTDVPLGRVQQDEHQGEGGHADQRRQRGCGRAVLSSDFQHMFSAIQYLLHS